LNTPSTEFFKVLGLGRFGCHLPEIATISKQFWQNGRFPIQQLSLTSSVPSSVLNYKLMSWLCGIWFLLGSCLTALANGPKAESEVTTLLVKLIDPEGKPVEGTRVGHSISREQSKPQGNEINDTDWFLNGPKGAMTGKDGIARLPMGIRTIVDGPHLPVVAWRRDRKLIGIAMPQLAWREKPGVISLEPECHVTFRLTCPELESQYGPIKRATIEVRRGRDDPFKVTAWMELVKQDGIFEFPAPPGAFQLKIETDDTESRDFALTVARGRRDLNLGPIRLSATKLALMMKQTAPEFRGIAAWINSPPLNMATLKGKVVLLDFWAYWCLPCVQFSIPELMTLHDEFHKQGLVIIGVHVPGADEPIDNLEKFERKVALIRAKYWKGRGLPFPVALAVSDAIPHHMDRCEMSGDYGVPMYPTTLLIDRQGRVAAYSVASPISQRFRATLKKLLSEK
jgi:thiol-disulfide isomerase/thioredoxin